MMYAQASNDRFTKWLLAAGLIIAYAFLYMPAEAESVRARR